MPATFVLVSVPASTHAYELRLEECQLQESFRAGAASLRSLIRPTGRADLPTLSQRLGFALLLAGVDLPAAGKSAW